MRVTSVELHPSDSADACVLSFRDPKRLNPYNVKTIIGLDADEIVPYSFASTYSPGTKYSELFLQKREIVVRIELNPSFGGGQTYSDLRDDLYRLISSSRTGNIQLQFKNGNDVTAVISGFVKKFESSQFSKTPEAQITIRCDDAMLRAPDPVVVDVVGLDPLATNLNDPLSTAPHGFTFEAEFIDSSLYFHLEDPTDSTWTFDVFGLFQEGDILHFSSVPGDKYLYVVRGLDTIHLVDVITPESVWPIMFPGDNNFDVTSPFTVQWNAISYYPAYWGV